MSYTGVQTIDQTVEKILPLNNETDLDISLHKEANAGAPGGPYFRLL